MIDLQSPATTLKWNSWDSSTKSSGHRTCNEKSNGTSTGQSATMRPSADACTT